MWCGVTRSQKAFWRSKCTLFELHKNESKLARFQELLFKFKVKIGQISVKITQISSKISFLFLAKVYTLLVKTPRVPFEVFILCITL